MDLKNCAWRKGGNNHYPASTGPIVDPADNIYSSATSSSTTVVHDVFNHAADNDEGRNNYQRLTDMQITIEPSRESWRVPRTVTPGEVPKTSSRPWSVGQLKPPQVGGRIARHQDQDFFLAAVSAQEGEWTTRDAAMELPRLARQEGCCDMHTPMSVSSMGLTSSGHLWA